MHDLTIDAVVHWLQRFEREYLRSRWVFLAYATLYLTLGGCSVGMAMSGKKDPNLGAFRVGSTRGEVELQLGSPISTTTTTEGRRVDLYEYEIGNEPSGGRAIAHGVMDVLTLGLWEIIGTPIEGFQGSKHRLTVTYDQEDRVMAINQSVVPPPPKHDSPESRPRL